MLKSFGYLLSTISVLLIGATAWDHASQEPLMLLALILGMALSIAGMLLRWLSFVQERRDNQGAAGQLVRQAAPVTRNDAQVSPRG